MQRVPVRAKGKTSRSRKTDSWTIPETNDPAPHAVVALVDEEIGISAPEAAAAPRSEETQGMRLEREARDLAAAWHSSRQLGQPKEDSEWQQS